MPTTTLAAVQCRLNDSLEANVDRVAKLVEAACDRGAQIILVPELFEGPYFCKQQKVENFRLAHPAANHPTIVRMQEIARRRQVVLPVPFFEQDGPHYYNSAAIIDADGSLLGVYRKCHIPDGPGYMEKYYFRPGNSGLQVFNTRYARIGMAICWDQWFPEVARELVLQGAQVLLYPTAIGSEPAAPQVDTRDLWQRAMQGHAVCNVVPVVAANRIGEEGGQVFYGSSFVLDHTGEKLAELSRTEEGIACAAVDFETVQSERAAWGFFRDRRPELYPHLAAHLRRPS